MNKETHRGSSSSTSNSTARRVAEGSTPLDAQAPLPWLRGAGLEARIPVGGYQGCSITIQASGMFLLPALVQGFRFRVRGLGCSLICTWPVAYTSIESLADITSSIASAQ